MQFHFLYSDHRGSCQRANDPRSRQDPDRPQHPGHPRPVHQRWWCDSFLLRVAQEPQPCIIRKTHLQIRARLQPPSPG